MRTFIAISIPDNIRQTFAHLTQNLKTTEIDVKWVNPASLHVTLKFLGEINEDMRVRVVETLDTLKLDYGKLRILLEGTGFFPDRKRPRVVWAGIKTGGRELSEVAGKINLALSGIGFPRENRSFKPHLTIGRIKSNRNIGILVDSVEKMKDQVFGEFHVNTFTLYQSILKPAGAVYKSLQSFNL